MPDKSPDEIEEGRTPEEIEAARKLFAGPCDFVSGAASIESLPGDLAAGSGLRRPLQCRQVEPGQCAHRPPHAGAAYSANPGHTRQVNFFNLADRLMLVDLPGYGFAKVSRSMKETWQDLASAYLRGRPTLMRIFVLIDGRHGVKESDRETMRNLDSAAVSYQHPAHQDRLSARRRRAARRRGRRGDRPQARRRPSRGPADQQRDRLRHPLLRAEIVAVARA